MLRPLRYAPAAFFALLALAFVGLWVRSDRWDEYIQGPLAGRTFVGVRSCYGVGIFQLTLNDASPPVWQAWRFKSAPLDPPSRSYTHALIRESILGLGFIASATSGKGLGIMLPLWFLVLTSLALAAILAYKPITRFTVRSLLMATTLLAAALGAVVYAL